MAVRLDIEFPPAVIENEIEPSQGIVTQYPISPMLA